MRAVGRVSGYWCKRRSSCRHAVVIEVDTKRCRPEQPEHPDALPLTSSRKTEQHAIACAFATALRACVYIAVLRTHMFFQGLSLNR